MKYPPITPKMPHMLHGGDYNPDQWLSMKDKIWPEDMRLAKLAGINSLSVGIFSWMSLEPSEGVYTFEWLDEILDMMAENGISAVLATPSGARPAWVSKKYPEVLRVRDDRGRNLHGRRHNHCLSSPIYKQLVTNINTRLAERYKDHPALSVWHISNEFGGECHCDLCQNKFREWLKNKYKTLDALNEAWWTTFWSHRYSDWSEVESPSGIGEDSVHGLNLDWKRFTTDQYIDWYNMEIETLKRITPDIPITTNLMGTSPVINLYKLAKHMDVVSWDSYPSWKADANDWKIASSIGFKHDINRSLKQGKPFMLMESCPSATNWQPTAKLKAPDAHLLYSMQAVAHGSDTVQYFQFRKSRGSSEKFHGAVVDHVGHEHNRVFKEVAKVGASLAKLDDIVGCTTDAKVAILYDWENAWAIDDIQALHNEKGRRYEETVIKHYTAFWKCGINVDIVDEECDYSKYDVLVTPMAYMLRGDFGKRVDSFVRDGGTLVSTYVTGMVDENDLCILGGWPGDLRPALGVWCEETDALYEDQHNIITYNGKEYKVDDICELIHGEGADILGEYKEDFYAGQPAVTKNEYGKGSAYFIAARCYDDFLDDFYGDVISSVGIKPVLGTLPKGVSVTSRTDGENEFVFVMNFMPYAVTVDIESGGYSLLNKKEISGEITLPKLGLEIFVRS